MLYPLSYEGGLLKVWLRTPDRARRQGAMLVGCREQPHLRPGRGVSVSVPAEPAGVEVFSGGWVVGAGLGGAQWPGRAEVGWFDRSPAGVDEAQGAVFGVAGDREVAVVELAVVERAQAGEVSHYSLIWSNEVSSGGGGVRTDL